MDASDNHWAGKTLGIIGAGNMAEALVRGMSAARLLPPGKMTAFDPLPDRQALFAGLGCRAAGAAEAAACDALLISVKPQSLRPALAGIRSAVQPGTLILSIAAGVSSRLLAELLPPGVKIIRIMPNTPLLIGFGVSCLARGPGAGDPEMRLGLELFAAAGDALELPEEKLDAVTALSGCGPAYLFRFAEALMAGGEALGLDAGTARRLAAGTLRGAAEMLARGGEPAELRERVTSRGGATAEALKVFDAGGLMELAAAALAAAERRSGELGREA